VRAPGSGSKGWLAKLATRSEVPGRKALVWRCIAVPAKVVRGLNPWVLVLVYAGAVSAVSQMSRPPIPPALQFSLGTLTLHAVEFGGFAFLLLRAFARTYPHCSASGLFLVTVAGTAAFAVADEVHQYFVPGRHCEAADALADVVGGFIVALLQAARRHKRGAGG